MLGHVLVIRSCADDRMPSVPRRTNLRWPGQRLSTVKPYWSWGLWLPWHWRLTAMAYASLLCGPGEHHHRSHGSLCSAAVATGTCENEWYPLAVPSLRPVPVKIRLSMLETLTGTRMCGMPSLFLLLAGFTAQRTARLFARCTWSVVAECCNT